MSTESFLFVSYARDDADRVRPLLDAVQRELTARRLPVRLWVDTEELKPGQMWDVEIARALESSVGLLFFVSERSSRSQWVQRELAVVGARDKLVIPILLDDSAQLPFGLATRQYLRYVGDLQPDETKLAAARVGDGVEHFLRRTPEPRPAVTLDEAPAIAADLAQDVRASVAGAAGEGAENSVFVVHGHDEPALNDLETYLASIGITPIVLARQSESAQSLFQKFLTIAGRARFAIVLLSADDLAASRLQFDQPGVGERALQFRARQNVILELGFFYGHLGFESVFVVAARLPVFPNFERPSDLDGVVFETMVDPGWREKLAGKLRQGGFALRAV
jgi:predicted nucleotide-binding protein